MYGRFSASVLACTVLIWLFVLIASDMGRSADPLESQADIEVFVRAGCPHCTAAKRFLEDLHRERPGLRILLADIGADRAALERLHAIAERRQVKALGVPAFYIRGELIIGYTGPETTGKRIKALLDRPASRPGGPPEGACPPESQVPCKEPMLPAVSEPDAVDVPIFGRLRVGDLGLPAFTIALGLLDGFNPCAMWVLLFLLSLLVNLRTRWKMVLIAGIFVAVSGLVYFAFMAAWLNVFLLIGMSRLTQITLGGIAGFIGVVNVKDFFALHRGVSLSIPDAVKPGLYARIRRILQAENVFGAMVGAVALAILVNVIELLCTAGFPAVYTQILAQQQFPQWKYYAYLGLYNAAYVLDDSLVVALAVVTLGRRKLQEHEGRWLKLASGLVMLGLGAVLIAKPEWVSG